MWQISPPHLPRELEQSRLPSAEPLLSVTDRLYSMVYQWLHPVGNSEHYQVEKCKSHPLMPILCSCHLLIDTNTPDHRPKSHKLTNTMCNNADHKMYNNADHKKKRKKRRMITIKDLATAATARTPRCCMRTIRTNIRPVFILS